jgi:predicted transcriptional regulator
LFSVEGGIPFIAGLLDGDGSLPVFVKNKDRSRFGEVYRWTWSFAQRKYPFLVDYLEGFVESLAPNSTHRYKRDNLPFSFAGSVLNINILKRGGEALLGAGIGRYSWKVAQWLTKVEEAYGERRKYMRTGQIAEMLNVSRSTVKRLLKTYGIKDYVGGTGVLRKRGSRIYVSKDEFEKKLREKLPDEKERAERIGAKLTDVAKMLGVSPRSIRDLRYRGKLQAAKVSDRGSGGRGGHTYLVIPREEVERLKHELGKPVNC